MELLSRLQESDAGQAIDQSLAMLHRMLDLDFAVVLSGGAVTAAAGRPPKGVEVLIEAAEHGRHHTFLPRLGEVDLSAAPLRHLREGWVVVSRRHRAAFTASEHSLVAACAGLLDLQLRAERAREDEVGLRQRGEQEMLQRQRAERELAHQALHDRLTGLANRRLVRDRAEHALERSRHEEGFVAAVFIDVDHFKLANDSLDHQRGDDLLVLIAQRLSALLALEENARRGCTLGRPGGDEFILLCEHLGNEHEAVTVAQQLQEAMRAPFFVDGRELRLTVSIGIACAPGGDGDGLDADILLRDADVALSRAKERGRDRYEIFDERMRVRLLDRVALESALRSGLERDELRLLYQPVVAVSDGSLAAVEALVRWQHPTRGLLGPHEFIPVAEESELIVSLGAWVIEEACAQLGRWRDADPAGVGVRVSVNVSARQLSPTLVETVADALERNRIQPSQLALEITESLLIEHTASSREVLTALERLGVMIVLDDFGTGYSSLSYLNEFPLGALKLDRTFTAELARDPRSAKIIAATIDMARALGMTVVAEGVETVDQLEVLRRLECEYAQGYLFARPEAPEQIFDRILSAYEHDRETVEHPTEGRFGGESALHGPRPIDPHRRQQLAIGRLAGWLFLVGSLVAIPSDLVMHAPSMPTVTLLTLMGLLTGAACLVVPWHRMSENWLSITAVAATVEITLSVLAIGQHGAVLQPIYLLVATAVAYAFRDRRVIVAHVAFISAVMTIPAWRADAPSGRISLTLISICILWAISAVIAYLREILEGSAAELRELAGRDPLTDVGNYRLLHERLEYELIRHHRERDELAVLLIDLDRFKQVNERRGHAAGDDVLRRVAVTLREAVRQQDTVARQGGDEFAILAPGTGSEGAAMVAARIRERLSRIQFAGDSVGATIGWAVYPADGNSGAELLARADEELRASKLHPQRERSRPAPHGPLAGALARLDLLGGSERV